MELTQNTTGTADQAGRGELGVENLGWVPSACTLPTAQQPLRVAEFDAFFAGAVQGVTRIDRTRLSWDLEFSPEVAAQAAGLAARENGCCSFFTFTVADGVMTLAAQVPDAHAEVLDALQQRTQTAAAPA
ncbi:hypothetical protein [Actinomadura sp. 6N118]|uniref:hypothetical protein n=1 Tax=Actinomadura sp. 6N118 TaxID=3375151 RepID=UPI0037996C04